MTEACLRTNATTVGPLVDRGDGSRTEVAWHLVARQAFVWIHLITREAVPDALLLGLEVV